MPRLPTTAETPLTVKQTKFAADVADGQSKAAARRAHYKSSPPVPQYEQADRRAAAELANRPNVAAEIRRLTWLSCPPLADTAGMRSQAVRVIADLSRSAKSEQVRLNAALALYRIAEQTRAAASPSATTQEQDRLLDGLRALYRKIQATAGNPPATVAMPAPAAAPAGIFDDQLADPLPGLPVVADVDDPIDITLADQPSSSPSEEDNNT
jgi:hypothetical protein